MGGRFDGVVGTREGRVRAGTQTVMDLDNGPHNAGVRRPFWKRLVEFGDATGLTVRLVSDPPDHSKDNSGERCGSSLERKWGGGLRTRLEVILGYARRTRWKGQPPTVGELSGEYADGVTRAKAQMTPVEARLERSVTLSKYDLTIRPRQAIGG
jgi:hypothetical protein